MPLPAVLAALVLGALCAVAVACGDTSQLLTERRADRLRGDIDRVDQAVDAGDCEATAVRLDELRAELADLPASVSPGLRERLTDGVAQLAQQATEECQGERTETLETQEEPAPPPETTETTETQPTQTETEPEPPPETAPEQPEEPVEPPAEPPAETPTGEAPAPDPEAPADPGTGGGAEGDEGTGGVGAGGTTP